MLELGIPVDIIRGTVDITRCRVFSQSFGFKYALEQVEKSSE